MKKPLNRRDFIRNAGLVTAGAVVLSGMQNLSLAVPHDGPLFDLKPLPYAANALEPHIDAQTMEIHHSRHHKAYVDNLNKALDELHIHEHSLDRILMKVSGMPVSVRNNGGGHYNHSMFWSIMKPNGGGSPNGKVAEAINASFGSFDKMKEQFNEAAKSRFGSGWAWVIKKDNKLEITSTPNQDNPVMDVAEVKGTPLLALDVWEHAYYLKYQNKRADYINAWWNVINWEEVNRRLG